MSQTYTDAPWSCRNWCRSFWFEHSFSWAALSSFRGIFYRSDEGLLYIIGHILPHGPMRVVPRICWGLYPRTKVFVCLVWQTLPSPLLSKVLPWGFIICKANIHLNRASPLRPKYNYKGVTKGNIETIIELYQGAKDLLLSYNPDILAYFEQWKEWIL